MGSLLAKIGAGLVPLAIVTYAMTSGSEQADDLYEEVVGLTMTVKAKAELSGAAKLLRLQAVDGASVPYNLASFMRQNLRAKEGDAGVDPWGSEYRLEARGDKYTLRSCGPDRRCGNDDDVSTEVTIQQKRYR